MNAGSFWPLVVFSMIRKREMPIRKNKAIHTGANNGDGGAKDGFFKLAYHPEIFGAVNREPTIPAIWHKMTAPKSFRVLTMTTSCEWEDDPGRPCFSGS
jgi:hypothetical protein